MSKPKVPDLMTRSDAASFLDVSREWIRRLVDSGKLKALHTAGGKSLFLTVDVKRFQAERLKRAAKKGGR